MQFTAITTVVLAFALSSAIASPLELRTTPPVCPVASCDPAPQNNKCDITTSCINTQPNFQLHCACRAGYKASKTAGTDVQWRSPMFKAQEYRVFVKSGTSCNVLCDVPTGATACSEVTAVNNCA